MYSRKCATKDCTNLVFSTYWGYGIYVCRKCQKHLDPIQKKPEHIGKMNKRISDYK